MGPRLRILRALLPRLRALRVLETGNPPGAHVPRAHQLPHDLQDRHQQLHIRLSHEGTEGNGLTGTY